VTSISDSLASGAVVQYSTRQPRAPRTDMERPKAAQRPAQAVGVHRLVIMAAVLGGIGIVLRSPIVAVLAVVAFLALTFVAQLMLVQLHRKPDFHATFRLLPALRYARVAAFALAAAFILVRVFAY